MSSRRHVSRSAPFADSKNSCRSIISIHFCWSMISGGLMMVARIIKWQDVQQAITTQKNIWSLVTSTVSFPPLHETTKAHEHRPKVRSCQHMCHGLQDFPQHLVSGSCRKGIWHWGLVFDHANSQAIWYLWSLSRVHLFFLPWLYATTTIIRYYYNESKLIATLL